MSLIAPSFNPDNISVTQAYSSLLCQVSQEFDICILSSKLLFAFELAKEHDLSKILFAIRRMLIFLRESFE